MEELEQFIDQVEANYELYKEKSLKTRRFKHRHIIPLIEKLKNNSLFEIKEIGKSTENREIFLLKAGTGKTTVLLWSQMHGNEPTATQALFDLFNFFLEEDSLSEIKKKMLKEMTLYFIPMVNPDGAEVYKRRNALDIDPNRDAAKLQGVETQLIKQIRDEIDAQYGFNLHDQAIYYTAGATEKPATMSFLAPSFNSDKEIDKKRIASMELIVLMDQILQKRIPGQVGRYNDDFMPTAFGDNMQLWGTSTILFEAGGYQNDPEKQYVRQLNFLSILTGLYAIAHKYSGNFELMYYFNIPENKKEKLFDLLIRNATIQKNGKYFKIDIGIRREEVNNADYTDFEYKGKVEEIGDLTYFYGYEEIDAIGLSVSLSENKESLLIGDVADFLLTDENGAVKQIVENGFII